MAICMCDQILSMTIISFIIKFVNYMAHLHVWSKFHSFKQNIKNVVSFFLKSWQNFDMPKLWMKNYNGIFLKKIVDTSLWAKNNCYFFGRWLIARTCTRKGSTWAETGLQVDLQIQPAQIFLALQLRPCGTFLMPNRVPMWIIFRTTLPKESPKKDLWNEPFCLFSSQTEVVKILTRICWIASFSRNHSKITFDYMYVYALDVRMRVWINAPECGSTRN
jgi:hypothetical protein